MIIFQGNKIAFHYFDVPVSAYSEENKCYTVSPGLVFYNECKEVIKRGYLLVLIVTLGGETYPNKRVFKLKNYNFTDNIIELTDESYITPENVVLYTTSPTIQSIQNNIDSIESDIDDIQGDIDDIQGDISAIEEQLVSVNTDIVALKDEERYLTAINNSSASFSLTNNGKYWLFVQSTSGATNGIIACTVTSAGATYAHKVIGCDGINITTGERLLTLSTENTSSNFISVMSFIGSIELVTV